MLLGSLAVICLTFNSILSTIIMLHRVCFFLHFSQLLTSLPWPGFPLLRISPTRRIPFDWAIEMVVRAQMLNVGALSCERLLGTPALPEPAEELLSGILWPVHVSAVADEVGEAPGPAL